MKNIGDMGVDGIKKIGGVGIRSGDKILGATENIVGNIADNVEDLGMGLIELAGPEFLTKQIKKKYFGSLMKEYLPIMIFIMYYNYYQCFVEYNQKYDFLWQKWYIDHEDSNTDVSTILQSICEVHPDAIYDHLKKFNTPMSLLEVSDYSKLNFGKRNHFETY